MVHGKARNTTSDITDKDSQAEEIQVEEIKRKNSDEQQVAKVISYPITYREALYEVAGAASPIFMVTAVFTSSNFINGYFLSKLTDKNQFAAIALIQSIKSVGILLFSSPITVLNMLTAHDTKAGESLAKIMQRLQVGYPFALICALPAIGIFASTRPLLILFGQNAKIAIITESFFLPYLPGALAFFLRFVLNQFLNGRKIRKKFVPLELSSVLISIGLTYILALGKLGLPELGARGYGIAQAAESIICFVSYQLLFGLHKDFKELIFYKRYGNLREYYSFFLELPRKGLPVTLAYFGELLPIFVASLIAGILGNDQLTSQSILNLWLNLLTIVGFSLFVGGSTVNGQARGAKKIGNIGPLAKAGISFSTILPITFGTCALINPELLMRVFIDPEDLQNKTIVTTLRTALPIMALGNLFDSIRLVFAGALLGMNDASISTLASFFIQVFITVPLMFLLAFKTPLEVAGTMTAYAIGSLMLTILGAYRWKVIKQRLAAEIEEDIEIITEENNNDELILKNTKEPASNSDCAWPAFFKRNVNKYVFREEPVTDNDLESTPKTQNKY